MNRRAVIGAALAALLAGLIACDAEHLRVVARATPTSLTSAPIEQRPANALSASASVPSSTTNAAPNSRHQSPHTADDLLGTLPTGAAQRALFCARAHSDKISRTFCSGPAPTSLRTLQESLGIAYKTPRLHVTRNIRGNGQAGNPSFAFLGHTVSLTARLVSPINPRVIVFTPPANLASSAYLPPSKYRKNPDLVAMAFTRGEQLVELVARDPSSGNLRFFALRFEQACNRRGCSAKDLFTRSIEHDWTDVTLYDGDDLENTPADCNQCHRPGGHGTKTVLLMQSRRTPWTHFFRFNRTDGRTQFERYQWAHDEAETYAGIPGSEIRFSDPQQLQGLVENEGFMRQPVSVFAYAREQWGIANRQVARRPELSLTWLAERKRAVRGEIPAVPFPVIEAFDLPKLEAQAATFKKSAAGSLGGFLRADVLRHVGLAAPADADATTLLTSMCRRCHQKQNPALSRARFDVDAFLSPKSVAAVPTEVLRRARERLALAPGDVHQMPPRRFGRLTAGEIATLDAYFEGLERARR